jgi:hypothetical protein
MGIDGMQANDEMIGYLMIGHALGDEAQHHQFAFRQPSREAGRWLCAEDRPRISVRKFVYRRSGWK